VKRTRTKTIRFGDYEALLAKEAFRIARTTPWLDVDDLRQEAYLAFRQALERFEPGRRHAFSTYLTHRVRGHLRHFRDSELRFHGRRIPQEAGWELALPSDEAGPDAVAEFRDRVSSSLSSEAREVAAVFTDGPDDILRTLTEDVRFGAREIRNRVYAWLRRNGHADAEARRIIKEIREFCSA